MKGQRMSEAELNEVLSKGHITVATTVPVNQVKPSKQSKYKSERVEVDGYKFDSKLEAAHYLQLKEQQKLGEVLYFLMQVPIILTGGIRYRVDFQVFYRNGNVSYQDTKFIETKEFKLKMKLLKVCYPLIKIELIRVVPERFKQMVNEMQRVGI